MLPVLCLLMACGGPESLVHLNVSLTETEVSAEAGSVFVRVACEGSWTLEIQPPVDWATLGTTSGLGNKNSIILDYKSNPGKDGRSLTIVALASGGKVTASATLTQQGYMAPTPSAGGGVSSTSLSWLELQATSETDRFDVFWRFCEINGTKMRNYTFYWNYEARVSMWVAYPLCKAYLGSVGRSDAWGYDPLLPAAKQQNVSGSYSKGENGSSYARGHQIPSADRTASYALNATTFYSTNMTPQNNDFNGGIWASLEGKVRTWANQSDTLFVVTGCVVDGAKDHVFDRSKVQITVPTAYFKAILRYSKSTTIGASGFIGAGFWFEHKNYSNTSEVLKAQSMSLSDLEAKLGYTLFVNLPDRVGAATAASIKSEKPSSINWWW